MREQHAQSDALFAASGCAPNHEAGKNFTQRSFEIEDSPVIKQHGDRSCCQNFGYTGEIENCCRSNSGRITLVRKAAYGVERNDYTLEQDAICCSRKRAVANGLLQDGVRFGKTCALVEIGEWKCHK